MPDTVVRDMRHILAAAALVLAASSALANHEVEHTFQQGIPADGIRRVVIDIPAGDITVRNGSRSSLVIIGKTKRGYDGTDRKETNQKIVDHVTPGFYVSNE